MSWLEMKSHLPPVYSEYCLSTDGKSLKWSSAFLWTRVSMLFIKQSVGEGTPTALMPQNASGAADVL